MLIMVCIITFKNKIFAVNCKRKKYTCKKFLKWETLWRSFITVTLPIRRSPDVNNTWNERHDHTKKIREEQNCEQYTLGLPGIQYLWHKITHKLCCSVHCLHLYCLKRKSVSTQKLWQKCKCCGYMNKHYIDQYNSTCDQISIWELHWSLHNRLVIRVQEAGIKNSVLLLSQQAG